MIRTPHSPATRRRNALWSGQHFFWPGCQCCRVPMVVAAHTNDTTTFGFGSISRLNPDDGTILWTTDLGTDSSSGKERAAYRVALDSGGNVYALWMLRKTTDVSGYMYDPPPSGKTVGGVAKLDSDGNVLDLITLGTLHASFPAGTAEPEGMRLGRIVVDPNDDDRIYFSCMMDNAGYWVYRVDATLSTVWGFGPSATSSDPNYQAYGGGLGMALDNDGDLFVSTLTGKTVLSPMTGQVELFLLASADGSILEHANGQDGPQFAVLVDSLNNSARSAGRSLVSSTADRLIKARPTPLNSYDEDWVKTQGDYSYSTPGAWTSFGNGRRFAAGLFDGTRYLWGNSAPIPWDQTGSALNIHPSIYATDRNGAQLYCVSLTNGTGGEGQTFWSAEKTWDLSLDEIGGGTYAAGRYGDVSKPSTSRAQVVRFGHNDGARVWASELFPADSAGARMAFGICARSVRV